MAFSSSALNARLFKAADVVLDLADAAGADQRRGHAGVAQHPGERHLRQRLARALCAMSFSLRTLASFSSVMCSGRRKPCGLEAREPSGMPPRYLSVSRPCASGEKAMQPMPSSLSTSSRPSSTQRLNMLYDGW